VISYIDYFLPRVVRHFLASSFIVLSAISCQTSLHKQRHRNTSKSVINVSIKCDTHTHTYVVTMIRLILCYFCLQNLFTLNVWILTPQSRYRMSHTKRATVFTHRSWWSRGLRFGSRVAHLLGLRVRIPQGLWKSMY
jgi:hypothetical protein